MTRVGWFVARCATAAMLLGVSSRASAQAAPVGPEPSAVQIGVSVVSVGSTLAAGSSVGALTRPDGSSLTLFTVDSKIAPALGLELSVTRQLGRRFAAEVSGSWSKSEIRAEIGDDFEGAAGAIATDRLQRVTAEGALVWTLIRRGRAGWYLRVGAGWFRDLAGRAAVPSDGGVGNLGVGVKYWWHPNADGKAGRVGIRVEGRASAQVRGQVLGSREARIAPAVAAGVLLGF